MDVSRTARARTRGKAKPSRSRVTSTPSKQAATPPPAPITGAPPRTFELRPARALALPVAFIVALAAMIALPSIHDN